MDLQNLEIEKSYEWAPELNKLLRKWKKQIEMKRKGHYNIARKLANRHYILGVPATILTTITSTGILSTFRNCSEGDNDMVCEMDQYIRLTIGIVGLIDIALTGVMTFMNYQEAANSHKDAADNYESLYGSIESLLIIPSNVRGDPVEVLKEIRSKYDDLVRKSPNLPGEYQELSYLTVNNNDSVNIPRIRPRDIGLPSASSREFTPEDYRGRSILRSVVNDISYNKRVSEQVSNESDESYNNNSASEKEVYNAAIAEHNNFDSDDERDVCIGFDLDEMISKTPSSTIELVAAAAKRDQQRRVSVVKSVIEDIEQQSPRKSKLSHAKTPFMSSGSSDKGSSSTDESIRD